MNVLETQRLVLRRFALDDAAFIVELLNDPDFIRNIADRGVRSLADARQYLMNGPVASYERHGYGLFLVSLRHGDVPIGMCGLVRRDALPQPDIGFALLPAYRAQGYALEAASGVLHYARDTLGLRQLVAIAAADNAGSIAVLNKLGMQYRRQVRLADDSTELNLYALEDPCVEAS